METLATGDTRYIDKNGDLFFYECKYLKGVLAEDILQAVPQKAHFVTGLRTKEVKVGLETAASRARRETLTSREGKQLIGDAWPRMQMEGVRSLGHITSGQDKTITPMVTELRLFGNVTTITL